MRSESAPLMDRSDSPVNEPLIKEWLDRTVAGPLYGELAALSRPESAGYFQDASRLTQRKMTLKAWWSRTTKPMDGDFHAYMSGNPRVSAHARRRYSRPGGVRCTNDQDEIPENCRAAGVACSNPIRAPGPDRGTPYQRSTGTVRRVRHRL